jgi:hypothetical protein
MLLNYRNILIGLSAISTILCDGPQSSDSSSTREHLQHEPLLIPNLDSTSLTTTKSSTGYEDDTPVDLTPVTWEPFDGSGDDADREFMSLFSF